MAIVTSISINQGESDKYTHSPNCRKNLSPTLRAHCNRDIDECVTSSYSASKLVVGLGLPFCWQNCFSISVPYSAPQSAKQARLVIGSLPAVSFKLRRLCSEKAGPNGLGFVEVTLCDIELSENFDNFMSNSTTYHSTPVPPHQSTLYHFHPHSYHHPHHHPSAKLILTW